MNLPLGTVRTAGFLTTVFSSSDCCFSPLPRLRPALPQMYESDGSVMVYWHALDVTEALPGKQGRARQGKRLLSHHY